MQILWQTKCKQWVRVASQQSGFQPAGRFGPVPNPAKNPTHFVLAGLLPGPDRNPHFLGQVYHAAETRFCEMRASAPIKDFSCDWIKIRYIRKETVLDALSPPSVQIAIRSLFIELL